MCSESVFNGMIRKPFDFHRLWTLRYAFLVVIALRLVMVAFIKMLVAYIGERFVLISASAIF